MVLFLEELALTSGDLATGGFLAFLATIMIFVVLFLVALYVYMSFAYMAIAKKNKQSSPGIAWIPGVGPSIIAYRAAKMHWWPWLLIIGIFIPVSFISTICAIAFGVFNVIWHWKLFEAIKKPGWWSIFMIIPVLNIVFYVLIGVAAWSKSPSVAAKKTTKKKSAKKRR